MPEERGIGRLDVIVIDVNDFERAAAFWTKVLGVEVISNTDSVYWALGPQHEGFPIVALQMVPEERTCKSRTHIDIRVSDVGDAAKQVEKLGGRRLHGGGGGSQFELHSQRCEVSHGYERGHH